MKDQNWFLKAKKGYPNRAQIWNDTLGGGFVLLWPVTTESFQEWATHLAKARKIDLTGRCFDVTPGGGRMMSDGNWIVVGLGDANPSPGLVAHECFHVVNQLLDERGIPSSYENDEVQAYVLQWAVDRCWNLINQ